MTAPRARHQQSTERPQKKKWNCTFCEYDAHYSPKTPWKYMHIYSSNIHRSRIAKIGSASCISLCERINVLLLYTQTTHKHRITTSSGTPWWQHDCEHIYNVQFDINSIQPSGTVTTRVYTNTCDMASKWHSTPNTHNSCVRIGGNIMDK